MHGVGALLVSCETTGHCRLGRALTLIGFNFPMPSDPGVLGPCFFLDIEQTDLRQPAKHECCELFIQPSV
jgi:hypothetical protein